MPIIVLIDVSLSMLGPLEGVNVPSLNDIDDGSNVTNRKDVAVSGVLSFIEYLETQNRHEFVSLASFSDDVEMVDFTRDYSLLKHSLTVGSAYDVRTKTDIVESLRAVLNRCVAIWGSIVLCHVVLLTDCAGYSQPFESLVNSIAVLDGNDPIWPPWKLNSDGDQSSKENRFVAQEFRKVAKRGHFAVHTMCINKPTSNDRIVQHNVRLWKRLADCFESGGSFCFVDVNTPTSWILSFRKLADQLCSPSLATLRLGTLSSPVEVLPSLKPITKEQDFDIVAGQISDVITIVGFLKPSELGSPPVASRHLLLAVKGNANGENVDPATKPAVDDEKNPNFCVLLHGAMKLEDRIAICEVGPGWYGYIHHAPNAKRSNLILHCFEPGSSAVPWLGHLNKLSLKPYAGPPVAGAAQKSPFPVAAKSKPSYATTVPNWIHSYGLQADIQKVLRYARKLPEKEPHFYQELSRICNQALGLGFVELLIILARTFEKEIVTLGPNSPQSQTLKHVVDVLVSGRMKYGVDPLSQFAK